MDLTVQVDEVEPGSAVVRVRGDVDVLSVERLRTPLQDLAARGVRDVVLDLSQAGYFDSSGMGMLLAVYGRLSAVEGTLVLARLSPGLQRLFNLTRFDDFLPIHPTVEEALEAVRTRPRRPRMPNG